MKLTHIGGPTVLIELDGRRLLTDPTFDAPGRAYRFGWGTGSVKTAGPAIPIHYEGWKHFREGRTAIEREFAAADEPLTWLALGEPADV